MLGSTNNNSRGNFTVVEGMEVHDITDNDLFRFFLNEDELSRSASEQQCPSPSCSFSCSCSSSSSPDSSQSGSISSPEPEFDSPPSSPSSPPSTSLPFVEVKTEKDTNNFLAPSLWPSSLTLPVLKEEPKDILQSFSFAGLDLSSPISLDMAVNALDQELKKRKNALSTKIDTTPSSKTTPASNNNSALSREDLLKLSTKSLDSYASTVNSNRSLTEDEERQLKRQRRLIKNRESAQLSRQRKRLYIEELEKKVTALSAENTELIKQVTLVTSENGSLKEENFQLQTFIKQLNETQKKNLACTAVPAVKVETVTESKNSSMKVDVTSSVTPSSPQTSHAESAATVVPSINISMEMEERAIEVIDKEVSHSPSPLYYYLEHPEELRKILGGANKKKGKKRKKDDNSSNSSASLSSQSNSSETEEISSAHIYFCPEAQELKTADKRNTRANSGKSLNGSVVSFLLPYSSVYPQKSACVPPSSSTDSTLVELSCQVLDTKTYPLSLPLKYERTYAAVSTSV